MREQDAIARLVELKAEIYRRFAVKDLAVFGSTARGEARAGSDIDVLVTLGCTFTNRPLIYLEPCGLAAS
ncbi:MAG: nucleotidyltransferase family protein [Pirellulales bacterium]